MPASYIYISGQKYWYYGSYEDKRDVYAATRKLKKIYGGKYFVTHTEHWYGTYPIYHVYATKVRKLWT